MVQIKFQISERFVSSTLISREDGLNLTINFHPRHGTLLYCDFSGFKAPEMVKCRPVVVISRKHAGLCTVVPLSGTEPTKIEKYHHEMSPNSLPENLRNKTTWWAKCDCVTTVAFRRLDRIQVGRDPSGKRLYRADKIGKGDLDAIKRGLEWYLCIEGLIPAN